MEPMAGHPESQVLLQELPVNTNERLQRGGEPGHRGRSSKPTVALRAAAVVTFGLLVAVTALAVRLAGRSPAGQGPCCLDGWVGYRGKCYYFSERDGNWTYSRSHCSALGASLAGIDSQLEMDFLLRYKGKLHHWIGLRRDPRQPWKWANGAEFNNWFGIRGDGDCAYLNDKNGVSSLRCTRELSWICSKPDALTAAKEMPAGRGS